MVFRKSLKRKQSRKMRKSRKRTKKLQGGFSLIGTFISLLAIGAPFNRSNIKGVIDKKSNIEIPTSRNLKEASIVARDKTVGTFVEDGITKVVFGEKQKQNLPEPIQRNVIGPILIPEQGGQGVRVKEKYVYELPLNDENKELVKKSIQYGIVGDTCYNPSGKETECKIKSPYSP